MTSGEAPIGEGKDHDGQAVGEGNRGDTIEARAVTDHGCRARADEHEREGADEFREELRRKRVWHC